MSAGDVITSEVRKPILEFPNYFVSDRGRVESHQGKRPRLIAPSLQSKGYLGVALRRQNRETRRLVHRLVLRAFVGPCPEGMETRHLDGVRTDNRLDNLCYGSPADNYADRLRHGTDGRGSRCGTAKLTEVEVLEIRRLYAAGMTQRELAIRFRSFEGNIEKICRRVTWRHI